MILLKNLSFKFNRRPFPRTIIQTLFLPIFLFFTVNAVSQELISSEFLESRSWAQMQADISPLMQNGVELYKITYTTLDVFGVLDTASGLLVLPVRSVPFVYPLLCYQHGTVSGPNDVPSNIEGGSFLAMVFGAMGYVTAAADYLGLGEARGFHPYVHAKTEASAAIDLLYAVRQYASENNVQLNDQLFISGYSQGGHAAAAVQREIQENFSDDFTITASAPMSGPYDISGATKAGILSNEPYYQPSYMPYTVLSYNMAYGINYSIGAYFKEPYASSIQIFFDGNIELSILNNLLINQLTITENGAIIPNLMLQDSIIDIVANQPNHPLNVALRDNDLIDWTPQAPTRLYYCTADDQVSYLNSVVADSIMNLNGAPDVQAIDVDPTQDHGGCVSPAITSALFFFANYQTLTVGNEEVSFKEDISIYPNPAKTSIRLLNAPEESMIEIFDIKGQTVFRKMQEDASPDIDINHLSTGLYWVRISKDGSVFNTKLVVN